MTPEQRHLVRRSYAEIEAHAEIASLVFFRRLFELAPAVRPLFTHDIEEQGRKFSAMLHLLVDSLGHPAKLREELRSLGRRHAGYGVKEHHYGMVGTALREMLEQVLGERFTPVVAEAWGALFSVVETEMLRGAALPAEAGKAG